MAHLKMRVFIILFSLVGFFGPFAAVVTIENAKQAKEFANTAQEYAAAQKETEAARYQYYLDLADRRNNSKAAMNEAKTQYEQLLKNQPDLITQNQKTVTQTTLQPVTTQQVVSVPVTTPKPKSSTKTKTS